jgi:hypothetical protein
MNHDQPAVNDDDRITHRIHSIQRFILSLQIRDLDQTDRLPNSTLMLVD